MMEEFSREAKGGGGSGRVRRGGEREDFYHGWSKERVMMRWCSARRHVFSVTEQSLDRSDRGRFRASRRKKGSDMLVIVLLVYDAVKQVNCIIHHATFCSCRNPPIISHPLCLPPPL